MSLTTVILLDGSEIQKNVAERIYHSLREHADVASYEIKLIIDAVRRNQRNQHGLIKGVVLINQQEFLQIYVDSLTFKALEEADIVQDFKPSNQRTYIPKYSPNERLDRYSFVVPKDVEVMIKNMFLVDKNPGKENLPSWDERFLKQTQFSNYESGR